MLREIAEKYRKLHAGCILARYELDFSNCSDISMNISVAAAALSCHDNL